MSRTAREDPRARWRQPQDHPPLEKDEVHVWRASLKQPATRMALLYRFLAAEETERASAFCFLRDRERFVVARGLLRVLLGRYLGCDPGELRFWYGARGKPHLSTGEGGGSGVEIQFSLSHSRGLALVALTPRANVGVDIERVRTDLAYERIADRFFSTEEVAGLRALPGGEIRRGAFFDCWTRKEAYIKAVGEGLSCSLDRFAVSLVPGEPAALLHVDGNRDVGSRWSLVELNPGEHYRATLAVEARDRLIRCFQCLSEDPSLDPPPHLVP